MFKLAVWAEDFEGIKEFKTAEFRDGFASGWSEGASMYGAGCCVTYRIPEDFDPESGEFVGPEARTNNEFGKEDLLVLRKATRG